ncbi:MAG: SRPBCC family protein [Myxococcota bacterium]
MRQLAAIAVVAAALVLVATIAWGWPGVWALLAIPPALLVGAALANAIDALMGLRKPRPVFVTLGGTIGTFAALVSLLFMWAVHAPEQVAVTEEGTVDVPVETIWPALATPEHWPRWDALTTDVESVGDNPRAVEGASWDTAVTIADQEMPTRHEVLAVEEDRHVAWRVHMPAGTGVEDLRVSVDLEPGPAGTHVAYHLAYRVPTVAGRALDRVMVRAAFHEAARRSLDGLSELADDLRRAR